VLGPTGLHWNMLQVFILGLFLGTSSVKVTRFLLKMMANRCFASFLVAKFHIGLFERLHNFCTKFQLGRI
jgi:hypothetical protein